MIRTRLFGRRAALTAAAAVTPALAGAQQQDTATARADSARGPARLAPVVTTASRYEATVGNTPRRIDVVTRADIERSGVVGLVDALKKLAAVDVIQYPGLLAGVGIRGFRPSTGIQQRTLVLLDGRPAGAYNLALLDLTNVERVEVLKGPASALYGSSAVGGAVNIVTRRSTGARGATLSARYGTYESGDVTVQAGGRLGGRFDADLAARVAAQGRDYRQGRGNTFRDLVGGDSARKLPANRPARAVDDARGDGVRRPFTTFHSRSGSGRLGAALGGGFRADLRGEAFGAGDIPTPGDLAQLGTAAPGNSRKSVARRSADLAFSREARPAGGGGVTHAPLLRGYAAGETGDFFDQPGPGRFVNFANRNNTFGGQLQDVVRAGAGTLTAGVDFTRVEAESRRFSRPTGASDVREVGTFSPNSAVTSTAAFAEVRAEALGGRLVATAGGRADRVRLDLRATPLRPDVTAGRRGFTVLNPSVGLQYAPTAATRVHGSVGRAFLAPDAFGLAGYAQTVTNNVAAITVGNPGLAPERSLTYDVGVGTRGPVGGVDVDVTYFRTAVRDRVTNARATFPAASRPVTASGTAVGSVASSANAGQATIAGLEARLAYDVGAALGRPYALRATLNGTRVFRAQERTRTVRVDVARFADARDFDATDIFGALVFSDTTARARIRNVAALTVDGALEYDDARRFVARLGGRYVGRRLDNDFSDPADFSDVEYPPFLVADLLAGVRLTPRVRADLLVNNVTDENYYEKRGYNLAGRVVQLRLTTGF